MTDAELIQLKENLKEILHRIDIICQECKASNESGEKHEDIIKLLFPSIQDFPSDEEEKKTYIQGIKYIIAPAFDDKELLLTVNIPPDAEVDLTFDIKIGLVINGKEYSHVKRIKTKVASKVKTIAEKPGRDIVFHIPEDGIETKGKPCDPKHFPKGKWKITDVKWLTDEKEINIYGPVKIITRAYQKVNIWKIEHKEADNKRKKAQAAARAAVVVAEQAASKGIENVATAVQAIADSQTAELAAAKLLENNPKYYTTEENSLLPFVAYVPFAYQDQYRYVENGNTGNEEDDYGYIMHYAKDGWTVGCIGILNDENAVTLAKIIEFFRTSGVTVYLLVQ